VDLGHFTQSTGWRLAALAIWVGSALLAVAGLAGVGFTLEPRVFSAPGLRILLRSMLPLCLMVPAMVMIVAAGGIDLSIGAVAALAGVLAARELQSAGFGQALAVALLTASGIGLVNGVLVGIARVHGVVVTLGMMVVVRGVAHLVSEGQTLLIPLPGAAGLPATNLYFWGALAAACAIGIVLVQLTPFGRRPLPPPTGRRESAAARAFYVGLPYVFSSVMAAVAGIVWLGRMRLGDPTAFVGYELDVILAVIVGGTCLGGRCGTVVGGLIGAAFVVLLGHVLGLRGLGHGAVRLFLGGALLGFALILQVYHWLVDRLYRRSRRLAVGP
jgi:ribose transport system permease protein